MGLAAVVLYPMQGYADPEAAEQVNRLGTARVRQVRRDAERIGEVDGGVQRGRARRHAAR